jgi:hypothetical protein
MNGKHSLLERTTTLAANEIIQQFQTDGVVCLRNALTPEEIELLKSGIDYNLVNPSPNFLKVCSFQSISVVCNDSLQASPETDTGLFVEDFCVWQQNSHYNEFIHATPLAALASLLTQSERVRLYHDHLLVKEPFTKQPYVREVRRASFLFDCFSSHCVVLYSSHVLFAPLLMLRTPWHQDLPYYNITG